MDLPDEHVVRYVVQMAAELEPGTSRGDVVGGAFALHLDKDGHIQEILPVPLGERFQDLETIALWINNDLETGGVGRRTLEKWRNFLEAGFW